MSLHIDQGIFHIVKHGRGSSIKLRIVNTWLGEIEKLYILPSERKRGFGSLLIHEIERVAKEKNLKKLCLLCSSDNEVAIRLYIKEDYEKEAVLKNHFRKGLDTIVFSKSILKEKLKKKGVD